MTDFSGWQLIVLPESEDPDAGIQLEQLDTDGRDWFAEGPGGTECGTLAVALRGAAGRSANPAWITAVLAAIARQIIHTRGSQLLVIRGTGIWYHASASRNRASIRRFGLDWRRMSPPGIAGSRAPETEGIFLCAELESAQWFAGMCRDDTADIWTVRLDGVWLESAPAGGGGSDWMICPEQIPPEQLSLRQTDIPQRSW